jgi:EAL domain-containing protein (putative c-di-GMP-specific phosphodiesterase class I)
MSKHSAPGPGGRPTPLRENDHRASPAAVSVRAIRDDPHSFGRALGTAPLGVAATPVVALAVAQLGQSIRERRIEPWFRPILHGGQAEPRGVEVIARLRLPTGGLIAVADLLPLAESARLILPLTAALLARLITFKAHLAPLHLAFLSVKLPVSALDHVPDATLLRTLVLARTLIEGLGGSCRLHLELTETAAGPDAGSVHELTARIGLTDTRLALNDLGTGPAWWDPLKGLALDCVRLDPSFVAEGFASGRARNLLFSIITLGRGLGLRVVAKGVERQTRRRLLTQGGADLLQGDAGEGPLEIDDLIRSWTGGVADASP